MAPKEKLKFSAGAEATAEQRRFDAFNNMSTERRIDAIAGMVARELHCDASEAIVFARELLRVRSKLQEVKFPELKARRFMSRNMEVSPIDEEFTFQTVTDFGTTDTGASYSNDAPRADVAFGEEPIQRIRPITAAYGYTFHEALVSAALNRGLQMRRQTAAKRAIDTEVERLLAFGDPGGASSKYGTEIKGFLNLTKEATATDSGVREYTLPAGAAGTAWLDANGVAVKSPDEIVLDMRGMPRKIVEDSDEVETPDTLILPLSCYNHVHDTRMGDGSDKTILQHFLSNSEYVKRVEKWHKLEAAPNSEWTGRRAVCYKADADVIEYLLPVDYRQAAPQQVRRETLVDCDSRCGGVVLYRPKAMLYCDGL